jgi:hypothetical protein
MLVVFLAGRWRGSGVGSSTCDAGADLDLLPVTPYMLVVVFGGKEVGKSDVTLPASETPAD